MSELERELKAALDAKAAAVTPDPQGWNKHRAAALTQPGKSSRPWLGQRRVLPLLIAAAVVLVAAVGTSIVVSSSHRTSPASPPIPATTAAPVTKSSRAATSVAPSPTNSAVVAEAPPTCTGAVAGSAQLTPAGVTGFTVRMQVRHAPGGDVLCAGITGAAGGTVQTSSGGTVAGAGPVDLAASSTWDQGSPVFVWGAVDSRVKDIHITGTNGKSVPVQFTALPSLRRAFVAVLPANTKTVTITTTAGAGGTGSTKKLTTAFGVPDALATPEESSPPAISSAATTEHSSPLPTSTSSSTSLQATAGTPSTTNPPSTTVPTSPVATTTPPATPLSGCDGPGMGIGIADLGVGSGMVSLNYIQAAKTVCFSNGGPLKVATRAQGVMPYGARTTLVSGQGVWGAVTPKVAQVIITDQKSSKGRPAQLLTLGSDLKAFVEETAGPVRLQAFSATGTVLYTLTLH